MVILLIAVEVSIVSFVLRKMNCGHSPIGSQIRSVPPRRLSYLAPYKGWFPYDRGSQIAIRSAIVCDHMETYFCDRLRSCDHDRRRSQKIEHKGWFPYD